MLRFSLLLIGTGCAPRLFCSVIKMVGPLVCVFNLEIDKFRIEQLNYTFTANRALRFVPTPLRAASVTELRSTSGPRWKAQGTWALPKGFAVGLRLGRRPRI